jgi:hypothetical protein
MLVSFLLSLGLCITFGAAPVFAQQQNNTGFAGFNYKPPLRGAPSSRVGGGTRGIGVDTTLTVLAPDHPGLTVQSQPTLYWFVSGASDTPLEVAINAPQSVQPLFERKLQSPNAAGFYSLALADYGVVLQPDIEYEWFVALVPDAEQRSNDVLSGGVIKRIEPDAAMQQQLTASSGSERARLYAEHGLWYDMIASLNEQIAVDPKNAELHQARAALLEQVGLDQAAAFDKP